MNKRNPSGKGATGPDREITAKSRHNRRGRDGRFLPGESGLPDSCRHLRHGLSAMKRAQHELCDSGNWLDSLGSLGVAVRAWRADLVNDLGGEESVSAQQRVIVDSAAKTMLLLASVDDYLLRNSFIDRRKKSLRPIVQQRMQMADSLNRAMNILGLQKREKSIPSLQEYLESRGREEGD